MSASTRERAPEAPWSEVQPGRYRDLRPGPHLRWTNRRTLWLSRRDLIARLRGDPSLRLRSRWVGGRRDEDLVIDRTDLGSPSFAVLGDTGDGDASQFAVVPPLLAVAGDVDLALIASDVVYPAGGVHEYEAKFHRPYRDLAAPILAVPGNHDWYDGLEGFMVHLCGAPPPRRRDRGAVERLLAARPPAQPGPYWALDTGPLRVIGIDTGILGGLDPAQTAWLRRVAAGRDVPKLLVTGKPLYADGRHAPWPLDGGGSLDALVRDPAHRFVAVLAGDVHNYQRYPVEVEGRRTIQHVVCGGGGAFSNGTHTVGAVDLPGVAEADMRLYPLRGDSMSWFASRFDAWARTSGREIPPSEVEPDVAAAIMGERLGLEPVRESARAATVTARDREAAARSFPPAGMRGLNRFYAQYYDHDEPPFWCSFLRLDVDPDGRALHLRCFAATGRAEHEDDPPVEDEVTIPLA
jgi:Calcineurin-like phosphoesterase